MIFSSYPFLLVFLPVVYGLFLLLRWRQMERAAPVVLLLASLYFYAAWNWGYLGLLIGSILFNYVLGYRVTAHRGRFWLVVAVSGNLLLLAYYKYAGFFFGFLPGSRDWHILLPLGISFFSFQQIAWQVDLHRKRLSAPGSLVRYGFFVSFFPQLIAGPIVHAREILPQIGRGWLQRPLAWEMGLALLVVGLMKKVLLADPLAPAVDSLFSRAANGDLLDASEVVLAGCAYGLQLYFDFSGYADMALGLGLMFGIRLPVNFRSPYKSGSIVEFWRRWHITLSHFLRDYLYIPLGGSRAGRLRANANLMITMLLGGLWHGAGWQFILWGGMHGGMLVINHSWSKWVPWRFPHILALFLTLVFVMLAWIPFRAESLSVTMHMYAGLFDWHWAWQFDKATLLREVLAMRIDKSLPWACTALLGLALAAPCSRTLCLKLGSLGRGALIGAGLLAVLKVMAGEPDRAFLYFNF